MDELRRAVEVMDRLYSPGGCPWDRKQTHTSLVPYLLEEAHELAEAIESGDRDHMREELGDVLLQVLFHARIAAEEPEPFTVHDVARELADKLVRRHPHVFTPDGEDRSVDDVLMGWEDAKRAEKRRASVLEGIPLAQGALARAQQVVSRATRAGFAEEFDGGLPDAALPGDLRGGVPPRRQGDDESESRSAGDGPASAPGELAGRYGVELLDIVRRAEADGVDAEQAMRAVSRALEARVRAAESAAARA
ncbi:MazG family protein [Myceligenerans pegani]|uniref:MazG family protein n=1 Tax=Myceligenerans pegani TaxID=2776917 RepID=A0ABR9MUC1_9MICO|nr:MazG family protein [Myceligenerans sp. TRM 65318]MBE1874661.1 MazG family protein [Myceligenerans sp. TRM 65318]MBE3016932.1 MazG family protein [Myceligenerans sp. TRM 65318]